MCSPQSPAPDDPHGLVTSSSEVGLLARSGVLMIRGYQRTLSRVLPPSCRFYPSCSEYTLIAIQRYGLMRGCWLGAKRIACCHPFHPGGIDHVP